MSYAHLKALQSVGFAKGMINLVVINNEVQKFLKSFEKLLRPTNNFKLFCGFAWEYVCMGVYVLPESGRKEKFAFLKMILNPKANEEIKIC